MISWGFKSLCSGIEVAVFKFTGYFLNLKAIQELKEKNLVKLQKKIIKI